MKVYVIILFLLLTSLVYSEDVSQQTVVFKPFVSFNSEYNSNFFKSVDNTTSSLMFSLLPGIKIQNKNSKKTEIKFDINGSYNYFMGISGSTDLVSENSDYKIGSNLLLSFFKTGNFSVSIKDSFNKFSYSGYSKPINKISNTLKAGFKTTPLGKSLVISFDYSLLLNKTIFTDELSAITAAAAESQDNLAHDFSLGIEWRFLPKTSVVLSSTLGIVTHPNAKESTSTLFLATDSMPFTIKTGLVGVITPKLATRFLLGWGYSNYDSGTNFNSLLVNIEATYAFTKKIEFIAGYEREFSDIIFANYLEKDNIYFKFNYRKNSISLGVDTKIMFYLYSNFSLNENPNIEADTNRTDMLTTIKPFISYNYKNKYKGVLSYKLVKNFTDFKSTYTDSITSESTQTEYNYMQNIITLNFFIFF